MTGGYNDEELLYVPQKSLLLQTGVGALFFTSGVFVVNFAFGRAETWFVWVWGSFWLLISGTITVTGLWGLFVSRPRFARLGQEGLELYRQHAPIVPWSQILDARLGPKKMSDGRENKYVFRHPLILQLKDRTGFPNKGIWRRAFPMGSLPDGTLEWMVPLDGCPCDEQEFLEGILSRLGKTEPTNMASHQIKPILGVERLDRPSKPKVAGAISAVVFIGFGLFFAWKGAEAHQQGTASLDWPIAKGNIKDANHYRSRKGSDFNVRYDYSINESHFSGRRVAFASMSSDHESWIKRFKPGASVDVYYNPENPAESVLIPGQQESALIISGFGLLFATVGSLPIIFYFRARKRFKVWHDQNPIDSLRI